MAKKYYWLKLKDNFFTQPKIKKLRKIAGGDTLTIIYLKMQLLSLKNEGKIIFEGIENDFAEELALTLDEDVENVNLTVLYLKNQGLLEEVADDEFALIEAMQNIGSETSGAERVRKHRQQKALHCNADVTECNTEIEKREKKEDIDLEKDIEDTLPKPKVTRTPKPKKLKYGEYQNVLLTDDELEKLKNDYSNYEDLIKFLDEYIEMKGYKAKSHYLAIKKWVVDAVNERANKKSKQKQEVETSNPFIARILEGNI